jgi:hypothetical protein
MSRKVGSVVAAKEASVEFILFFNIAGKQPLGKAILGAGGRANSQSRDDDSCYREGKSHVTLLTQRNTAHASTTLNQFPCSTSSFSLSAL